MSLPRPVTIVRFLAASVTALGGITLLYGAMNDLFLHKGSAVAGAYTPPTPGGWAIMFLWFVCSTYTGWRGMDREALQSGAPQ